MKRYNFSADVLRVLAISGVVIIHTANAVFARPDFIGGISWWFAVILNALSRPAIPLFIMVSGYFLLGKNESYGASLRRTFHRLVIPLIFWFLVNVIWDAGRPSLQGLNGTLIQRLLTVNVFDLYFFIILIGLYVVAPVLRAYLSGVDDAARNRFADGMLVAGVAVFASEYLLSLCSPANSLTYWVPYTGLFVAGSVIGNARHVHRIRSVIAYLAAFFVTAGVGYAYFVLTARGNNLLGAHGCLTFYTDSYASVNVVVMAVAAFGLLMHTDFSRVPHLIQTLVYSIARNTLGIYVLHTFVIDILDHWHVFSHPMPLMLFIVLRWFLVFSIAYICSLVLARIPVVRRVLGETK